MDRDSRRYSRSKLADDVDSIVNELIKERLVTIDSICEELDCTDRTLMNYRKGVSDIPAWRLWKLRAIGYSGDAKLQAIAELNKFGYSLKRSWKNTNG
ncbi:MAG: hypothetical protein GJ680_08415 [Alteromonadaceae bacterium]|nr:hypothetical protein [Alteromonadaceae bacterium]